MVMNLGLILPPLPKPKGMKMLQLRSLQQRMVLFLLLPVALLLTAMGWFGFM